MCSFRSNRKICSPIPHLEIRGEQPFREDERPETAVAANALKILQLNRYKYAVLDEALELIGSLRSESLRFTLDHADFRRPPSTSVRFLDGWQLTYASRFWKGEHLPILHRDICRFRFFRPSPCTGSGSLICAMSIISPIRDLAAPTGVPRPRL